MKPENKENKRLLRQVEIELQGRNPGFKGKQWDAWEAGSSSITLRTLKQAAEMAGKRLMIRLLDASHCTCGVAIDPDHWRCEDCARG